MYMPAYSLTRSPLEDWLLFPRWSTGVHGGGGGGVPRKELHISRLTWELYIRYILHTKPLTKVTYDGIIK